VAKISEEYSALKEQAGRTIDDLTHGIRMYVTTSRHPLPSLSPLRALSLSSLSHHPPSPTFPSIPGTRVWVLSSRRLRISA